MTDWRKGMRRVFRYYEVDPITWLDKRPLDLVRGCKITRNTDPLGETATLETDESFPAETIVRCYLDATQGGMTERHAVGTWVAQSPKADTDGKKRGGSSTLYSPLLDIDDDEPPFGYTVAAGADAVGAAAACCSNGRAPVLASGPAVPLSAPYSAALDATWLSLGSVMAAKASCRIAGDALGRIVIAPRLDAASAFPSWTFADADIESILLPDASDEKDWFGIPNVIEVIWSEASRTVVGRAVNDDPGSPTSTVRRGRVVRKKVANPEGLMAGCTQAEADALAARLLEEESAVEGVIVFSHGYCPVRVGDCVRVVYGLLGVDTLAIVTEQEIECMTGCTVNATATYARHLWKAAR